MGYTHIMHTKSRYNNITQNNPSVPLYLEIKPIHKYMSCDCFYLWHVCLILLSRDMKMTMRSLSNVGVDWILPLQIVIKYS